MSAEKAHNVKPSVDLSPSETLPVPVTVAHSVSVPRDFLVIPVPRYLRHNPQRPAHFGLFLNIVFAVATTFSKCTYLDSSLLSNRADMPSVRNMSVVANIYWCQPILSECARYRC